MKKKPCPFCGGTRLSITKSDCTWHDPPVAYSVSCAGGDCHGHIFSLGHDLFKTEKEAVEAWNERAEDEIKKLRSIISIPEKTLDRFERLASRMVSEGYAQGYREACNHIMRDIMEKLGEKQ